MKYANHSQRITNLSHERTNEMSASKRGITPEVGKRYVTRGGWITPPYDPNNLYPAGFHESLISEYVDPSAVMYRRDLIARIYVAMVMSPEPQYRDNAASLLAESAISIADTLIQAMEGK